MGTCFIVQTCMLFAFQLLIEMGNFYYNKILFVDARTRDLNWMLFWRTICPQYGYLRLNREKYQSMGLCGFHCSYVWGCVVFIALTYGVVWFSLLLRMGLCGFHCSYVWGCVVFIALTYGVVWFSLLLRVSDIE